MITTAPKRDNLKVWHAARRPSRVQYVCFWNLKPFCVQPLISWGHTVCVCCLGLRAASHGMTRRSRRPCVTHDRVHCGPKRKSSRSCLQLSAQRSTRGKQHQTVWKQCLRWVKVLHFMIWRLPTESLFASGDAGSKKFFTTSLSNKILHLEVATWCCGAPHIADCWA